MAFLIATFGDGE